MPARTRKIAIDQASRDKIKTTQLINRLTGHALGTLRDPKTKKKVELTTSQVKAIEVLLAKTMPNLQSISGNLNHHITHEQALDELE
jgi:hypothetical protein